MEFTSADGEKYGITWTTSGSHYLRRNVFSTIPVDFASIHRVDILTSPIANCQVGGEHRPTGTRDSSLDPTFT